MQEEECMRRARVATDLLPLTAEGRAFERKLRAVVFGDTQLLGQLQSEARLNTSRKHDGHLWRPVHKLLVRGG